LIDGSISLIITSEAFEKEITPSTIRANEMPESHFAHTRVLFAIAEANGRGLSDLAFNNPNQ